MKLTIEEMETIADEIWARNRPDIVPAIREYRAFTDVSLRWAKSQIEAAAKRNGDQ